MNDHKFTDDEIIKAYELCFTPKGTSYTCAKCPFHKIVLCKIERDRAALDLLHRQKAKIKRLQSTLEREIYNGVKADEEIEHLKAEIERLEGDLIEERTRRENAVNAYHEQKAEIERLNKCIKTEDEVREIMKSQMLPMVREITVAQIDRAKEIGRIEAITEFAERLIGLYSNYTLADTTSIDLLGCNIKRLVKEMTEGKNE